MKIDRLISIIMVLLNCEKISATKLAKMFEVTPRTIYRDVEAIAMSGIPIVTTTGVEGGISIMPQYKVDKQFFTISDIQALLMGLSSVSTTVSTKEIAGVLEKVKSLLPKEDKMNIELKANQITIDLAPWRGNKAFEGTIEKIKQALTDNTYLVFHYYDGNGEKSIRQVEPYQLVLKDGRWYLQGYCDLRQDFRVFKLSRMSNLKSSAITFKPREFHGRPLSGKGWIDKSLFTIKLVIDCSLREQIVERCGEDSLEPFGKNKFIVNFPFVEDDFGYSLLLGFGDKCVCLEPENVRNELIHRIEKLRAIYQ